MLLPVQKIKNNHHEGKRHLFDAQIGLIQKL